ncbi:CG32694 [Drosophila busckii]|uniref:CG32694 n=1 Tax=Drosophila busckii TaxID=30019 RepID=A0A0M3QYW4_DROBS|nr:uncharacterized protein LOC108606786 isoform X2 [Drosophila busckii]ALC48319.1 CG32694 [Drosophila busckii]
MRQASTKQILALLVCSSFCLISAIPLPGNQELDVLQIPLTNGQEIDVLTLGSKDQEQLIAERNKRTIGLLRELFPDITKEIDSIVNRIIAQVIRVAGPGLLNSVLAGNRGGGAAGGAGRTTTASSFDAEFDDAFADDDDDSSSNGAASSTAATATTAASSSRVKIDLPTFSPETESAESTGNKNGATDTQIDLSAINKQLEETIRVARQVKEAEAAAAASTATHTVAQVPIPIKSNEPIQLSFNNELSSTNAGGSSSSANDGKPLSGNDLQLSESKSPAIDELTLDSAEETADLDDRNKRFLSFGGAGLAGGSSGGSGGAAPGGNALGGGGSGNFLLDVVRLFSGSVQTQQGDEAANSVGGGASSSTDDTDATGDSTRTADGYTEGIPGPVTRLVVLANRGLANLVQDLILRVAATSEKFVNFKAKLITALI